MKNQIENIFFILYYIKLHKKILTFCWILNIGNTYYYDEHKMYVLKKNYHKKCKSKYLNCIFL